VKHLPKHLRPRWRYLAVELETWPDATLDRRGFQRELWFAAQNLLGDAGSAELDLTVVSFDHGGATGAAVVRTYRGETDRARAVLACLDAVDGARVGLRVTGISGTVRACEEKYIRRRPENSVQRNVAFGDAERSAVVRDGRADVRAGDAFTGATELDL
jgi:ribonuclease P/MRP protein subunit POP5